MLNEEINEKSINLAVRIGKLTYTELKKALEKLIGELQQGMDKTVDILKDPELKHGKQTLKQLSKHDGGLSTVELKTPDLRILQRSMKKHNVDFAAVKDGKGKRRT